MTQCSLIISTYNWPQALKILLESIQKQSVLPNEIIIADDGSTEETASIIKKYEKTSLAPIIHVWQEDKGFQLTTIRNKAIAKASYPYIIQIDGDLLLESHFIEDHLAFAKKNYFVRGSRSLLNKTVTCQILENEYMPSIDFLRSHCSHKLNSKRNIFFAKYMRNKYKTKGKNYINVIGCNMAFWRKDFISVNGYNEEITGWGPEDIELSARLLKAGFKKQSLKMAGVVFHLHHEINSKSNKQKNEELLKATLGRDTYYCKLGIDQYL